jgi:hypothetical protein
MTTTTATTMDPPVLTGADRCDRCGAQAYVRAVLTSGGELLFCGHHARAVEDMLRPQTTHWQDETSKLFEKEPVSAD